MLCPIVANDQSVLPVCRLPNMHPTFRLLLVCSCAVAAQQDAGAQVSVAPTTTTAALLRGVRSVYKTYKQCEVEPSLLACLKLRAMRLVEKATSLERIPVIDGISLVSRADSQRSLNDIPVDENSLPQDPELRDKRIDSIFWDKVGTFFQTHSLQLQVPSLFHESKSLLENEIEDDEEGRAKKKKYQGVLLAGLMMKGLMIALAYKALALLAGKALIVSKLALVLAGIVALKKLFSGGDHQKTTYEIVKQPVVSHAHQYTSSHELSGHGASDWAGSASGGYGRSIYQTQDKGELAPAVHGRSLPMESIPYPHLVAYRGQLPKGEELQDSGKSQ